MVAYASPAGSICLTANDMARYLKFLTRSTDDPAMLNVVPSRKVLRQTWEPSNYMNVLGAFSGPGAPYLDVSYSYALGWWTEAYRGKILVLN